MRDGLWVEANEVDRPGENDGPCDSAISARQTGTATQAWDERRPYTAMCMLADGGVRNVTRTNVELDDEIVELAMRLYGVRTKKETIDLALRRLVGAKLSTNQALALEESGWEGDLDAVRDDAPPESA